MADQRRREQASAEQADVTPTITPESRVQRTTTPDATPTQPPTSNLSLEELMAEIEATRRRAAK